MKSVGRSFCLATALVLSAQAYGKPCASLPYDELQDMTIEELTVEVCTARNTANDNRSEAFDKLMSRHSPDKAGSDAASTEADRCDNEVKRILRVLKKKGTDVEKVDYSTVCKAKKK